MNTYHPEDEICQTIVDDVDPKRIGGFLKYLSEEPHISGTERDVHLANYIKKLWIEHGLDRTELVRYDVLLCYPDSEKPNQVSLTDGHGKIIFSARHHERVLDGTETMQPFNAYSPVGNVTAEPIYANFGRREDFNRLEEMGIPVAGKICLIRYGKIYRGSKVQNAAESGAVGVVLFLCPSHVSPDGTDREYVYPNTWWMPGDAIQRGDIREEKGDPQTPGYPSLDGAYRIPVDQIDTFPKIPCQPICYDDAIVILRQLAGPSAPSEWTVESGINLGPNFKEAELKLTLVVNNRLQQAPCYNVIGYIEGAVEPDRYVILGNHRDAWVYGAADPSSGTAQMLEVSRVFGSLVKRGWRPNRTIMFCSWGGEEFGLIGSTEWIEENIHSLQARAVAYINVDICVAGDVFHPESCAMLKDVVMEAAKMVPDPKCQGRYLYDVWHERVEECSNSPQPHPLGPGTDHVPFYFYAGVSAINLSWLVDTKKYPNLFLHPAYHTAYDNFDMIDRFVDPGFFTHQACSRICGLLLHILADSPLLPHNICHLADKIATDWLVLRNRKIFQQLDLKIDYLEDALTEYQVSAREWIKQLKAIDHDNQLLLRRLNDEAMLTERIFLRPEVKSIFRHLIFSPYQDGFSALSNKLSDDVQESREYKLQFLQKYISDVLIATKAATKFIRHSKFPFL